MNSTLMMKALLVAYIIICIVSLFEKNWVRSLYWFGASILQTSVLLMSAIK